MLFEAFFVIILLMDEIQTKDENVKVPHMKRQQVQLQMQNEVEARRLRIDADFTEGFEFFSSLGNTVTVFGSARFTEDHPYYEKARQVGAMLAEEKYTVVTGGAGGIMEAANRGAYEVGGESVGMNILLPHEQHINPYVTRSMNFRYFFTRKVFLGFASRAIICFPGGFGTLDEVFEILTLMQTKRMPQAPIILFGKDFWRDLDTYLKKFMEDQLQTISKGDRSLYTITDNIAVIKAILRTAEYSDVYSALSSDFFEIT